MTTKDRDPAALPMGLRERVLAASLLARGAGQPVPAGPAISAAEAFGRAADAFYGLLCALGEKDWTKPALRGLDVQGLVGHLTGVEDDVHRGLAGDPAVAGASHVESTQAAAVSQAGRSPAQTRADWRRAADRTLDLVRAAGLAEPADRARPADLSEPAGLAQPTDDPGAKVAVHGMRLPLRALLVVRAFELWVHDNDIRRAVGLPPSVPDTPVLRLMSDLAARMLPYAATRTGLREPVDVHLVLTGPGGGTWEIAVGQSPPDPVAVAIVTDVVGFCRLAANRVTAADLDLHVTGDPGRAADVLAVVPTLALD